MTRITLLLIVSVSTAWPQASGSIAGMVTDSANRLPLHHVLVSAANGSRDVSGADGSFTLSDLPVGEVKLRLAIKGYRDLETSVKIADGDHLTSYFEMRPLARITGRILDKDTGEPVVRTVQLSSGGRLISIYTADKNGGFEFTTLGPGDYTVVLDAAGDVTVASDLSGSAKRHSAYGQAALPETIHLLDGEQKQIEMRLTALGTYSATVSIEYPPGYDEVPLSIGYAPASGPPNMMQAMGKRKAGTFRVDGLFPGEYSIDVMAGEGSNRAWGSVPVNISDHDVDGLTVTAIPGTSITGSVTMAEDGVPLPDTRNFAALLLAAPPNYGGRSEVLSADAGRFHDEGVAPGAYWPELDGLPDGYAVSNVLFNKAPAGGRPVSIYGPTDLTFVVTSKPGVIAGTVRDSNQAAIKGAVVTLVPEAYRDLSDPPSTTRTVSGATGEFRFRNLAPGKYFIEGAPAIELQPGQTATITVFR